MATNDQIDVLLDQTLSRPTKLFGVVVCIGLICIGVGTVSLFTPPVSQLAQPAPLPSFPSQHDLQQKLSGQSTSSGTVNLNTASLDELDQLPGIGAISAQKIIDNRPYTSFQDLETRSTLSKKMIESIRTYVELP